MMKLLSVLLITFSSYAGGLFDFSIPTPLPEQISVNHNLWATYYYLPEVYSVDGGFPLRNMAGEELGPVLAHRDWCNAALQGSVITIDSNGERTTYNYAGRTQAHKVDCSMYWSYKSSTTKFSIARGQYGDGVKGYKLVPYRTIAVDRKTIAYGNVVYIPSAVGNEVILPNGEKAIHDGYFFAGDTGSAIKKKHIDVYIGSAKKNPFSWVKSNSSKKFSAYIISDKKIIERLRELHL